MIRKLKSCEYRLYSRNVDPRTGRRRNLGTFGAGIRADRSSPLPALTATRRGSRAAAEKRERAVQFFRQRG
ncbi:MAG: hypothetical protein ACRD3G_28940 [Vicinamibacterales bacterium]